jgi:hypothetical protein
MMKGKIMAYTFDAQIVSDLHKDAYGVRPSAFWWECWQNASDDERQAEWDDLLEVLDRTMAREQEEERIALAEFDKEVLSIMEIGKCDERTALAWMTPLEFEDNPNLNSQDVEHWVWQNGILFTERGREIVQMVKQIHGVK